jgi:hypothetical protein
MEQSSAIPGVLQMNTKSAIISLCALLLCGTVGRANACPDSESADPVVNCWFPSAGKGFHVKYVVHDQRPGKNRIQLHLTEYPGRDFFYTTNTNDLAALSKANAIYASLLAARTSGDYVNIFLYEGSIPSGSDFWFSSVQVGEN